MKRIFLTVIALLILAGLTGAQFGPDDFEKEESRECLRERIKMVRMWKLVESLDLTEEQSVVFFPLFNEHDSAIDECRSDMQRLMSRMQEELEKSEPSEKELTVLIDSLSFLRELQYEKESQFYEKLKEILTVKQQAELVIFQRNFMREIRELIEAGIRHPRGSEERHREQ